MHLQTPLFFLNPVNHLVTAGFDVKHHSLTIEVSNIRMLRLCRHDIEALTPLDLTPLVHHICERISRDQEFIPRPNSRACFWEGVGTLNCILSQSITAPYLLRIPIGCIGRINHEPCTLKTRCRIREPNQFRKRSLLHRV